MNNVDSEVMVRFLEREGCKKIDSPEKGDIVILKRIIKYCVPGIRRLKWNRKK